MNKLLIGIAIIITVVLIGIYGISPFITRVLYGPRKDDIVSIKGINKGDTIVWILGDHKTYFNFDGYTWSINHEWSDEEPGEESF